VSSAWLAQQGADPAERAREIGRAHAAFLGDTTAAATAVRDVVRHSWLRSAHAKVDLDAEPPVTLLDDELAAYRASHRLAEVIEVLRDLVGGAVGDGGQLMAVSDAGGRLLWVEGDRGARWQAEAINFVEGAVWDEEHAGTNAPGTALAVDQPVQIFATEHFRPMVQAWTCAAAPIHDPATGQILGVVDITGGNVVAHPHSLALVRAAALAAEAHLGSGPARPRCG
jgi:transcriptional regulator of acetoin/glycerol metabolism